MMAVYTGCIVAAGALLVSSSFYGKGQEAFEEINVEEIPEEL